ncbi:hypothetical protein HMPREF1986_00342 [Oribacterium sp. oral taxon 078 str. F0263]|nr:hypothetical protein HMPREF1986_00342 [Oribacterium sp. oral taxon 078 str. F0263]
MGETRTKEKENRTRIQHPKEGGRKKKRVPSISAREKKYLDGAGGRPKRRKTKADRWISGNGLDAIKTWKRNGVSDEEIAKNIGVSRSTLNEWKRKYPDLSDAFTRARAVADAVIEGALFRAAKGHVVNLKKIRITANGDIIEYTEEHYIPPDVKAMIFYLTNRMPGSYKHNRDLIPEDAKGNTGGKVEIVVQQDGLAEVEARAIAEAMEKEGNANGSA